jgi:membrane protein
MPDRLRKLTTGAAPLLVLAGIALLPRARHDAPQPSGAGTGAGARRTARTGAQTAPAQDGRGRAAQSPTEIPAKGWKDILVRTVKEFGDDNIPMISAGMTFYTLLALFPGMAALIAIYGLFSDPADVQRHLQALAGTLPSGALEVIGGQLQSLAKAPASGLSLGFFAGLAASLWSASAAAKALIVGLNIAYEEHERRGIIKRTLISLAVTVGLLAFAILGMAALGMAVWLRENVGGAMSALAQGGLALVLLAVQAAGLALVYRYGPSREPVRLQWISWGSAMTVIAWLLMSVAFTAYVANFGHFNKVYGSLGAAVGLMTWLFLSSMVVLAGAELNSEIEHQTAVDTTRGPPKPAGARDAKMADTVGRATNR